MSYVVFWAMVAVVTALAAQARGRSFGVWLLLGFLTSVFGLIAVLVMENLNDKPAR